jgi:hypothetical protein
MKNFVENDLENTRNQSEKNQMLNLVICAKQGGGGALE